MNLIISSITIVDLTNKEAKRIAFSPQKNLLTSEQNHLGKSIIMKSLYYTLGAEVYFPAPIKKINLFTYIDFHLNGYKYRICRLKWSFTLYRDKTFIGLFSSVADFEETLCELFNLEINLVGKDIDGNIQKCPPAFYYLPYYIDQENGWAANSHSFDRITQFDMPQRKNSYFFHLGVFDKNYVEISRRKKSNERKKVALEKDTEKLKTVIETICNGLDDLKMSFDIETLEQSIHARQKEITKLLDDISKIRKSLIEAEDRNIQLEHEKEVLSKYIKNKKPTEDILDSELLECPRCGIFFKRSTTNKLEKIYLLESLNDDYTNILSNQKSIKRRIEKLRDVFIEKQKLLENYENTLLKDKDTYNSYIKSKATNQLLKEYREKIGNNVLEIDRLAKDNSSIRTQLVAYSEEKAHTNSTYLSLFDNLLCSLNIPEDQVEDNSEPGSSIVASGAYGPRCKVAQMLAFVETQKKVANNIISFPIVIDSPNALEQDKENLDAVIRTLLTWDKTDNQIIVSSIEGRETASAIPGVNIIQLDNSKNHLLNNEIYCILEDEINEMFIKF